MEDIASVREQVRRCDCAIGSLRAQLEQLHDGDKQTALVLRQEKAALHQEKAALLQMECHLMQAAHGRAAMDDFAGVRNDIRRCEAAAEAVQAQLDALTSPDQDQLALVLHQRLTALHQQMAALQQMGALLMQGRLDARSGLDLNGLMDLKQAVGAVRDAADTMRATVQLASQRRTALDGNGGGDHHEMEEFNAAFREALEQSLGEPAQLRDLGVTRDELRDGVNNMDAWGALSEAGRQIALALQKDI